MLVFILALWMIAAILIFTDPRRESIRWASLTAFIGAFGFSSAVIDEMLRPYLQTHGWLGPHMDTFTQVISLVLSFVCQNGTPYAFLMFAISSSDWFHVKFPKLLKLLLALPTVLMFSITPLYPTIQFNYVIFTAWVAPYILGASFLLFYSHMREKNPQMRKSRLFTNIVSILPMIALLITVYILRIFNINEAWRYNAIVTSIQFIAFIVFGVRFGVLGVKLRFESYRIENTIKALYSGTVILNHTFKDEIGKIRLIANQIESAEMQIILNSTTHMLNMVNRIQEQMQDVVVKEQIHGISLILSEAVDSIRPLAESQEIHIDFQNDMKLEMWCDAIQLQEVFNNILKNAIEAMNPGGELTIQTRMTKKSMIISIADNGSGIAIANLPFVFDPFFTTKDRSKNYGLGLSYCFNIMQKHGGFLDIHSEPKEGTIVFLNFPRKKIYSFG